MQTETLVFRPSAVRRKPLFTYKSPSGPSWGPFIDTIPRSLSRTTTSSATTASAASPSSSSPSSPSLSKTTKQPIIRGNPQLPLYHPKGNLALSLPPLDAVALGLPQVQVLLPFSVQDESGAIPSSAPGHRSSGRLRSVSADISAMPSVSSIAAVAAREIKDNEVAAAAKEKASPKKRGSGGGGGGKRKRNKAVDDTDPTYPAKRTRIPRGTAQSVNPEDENGSPATEAEPTPNPGRSPSDEPEVTVRTTRSRAKRRGSSETPSSDIPAPQAAKAAPSLAMTSAEVQEDSNNMVVDHDTTLAITPSAYDKDETPSQADTEKKDDKEEGELSD